MKLHSRFFARQETPVSPEPKADGIAWWMVGLSTAIGIALVAIAASGLFGDQSWASVVQAVLVHGGTTLALAAVIVRFLEPHFWKQAKRVAKAVQEPVMTEVNNLRQRVDNLADQTADLLRTKDQQVNSALRAVTEIPSFETVTKALEMANDLNALAGGIATVQAGADPTDPEEEPLSVRVRFLWGSSPSDPNPLLRVQAVCGDDLFLVAHPELQGDADNRNNDDRLCAEIEWPPEERPAIVGVRLIEALRAASVIRGDGTFDWDKTVSELERTLTIAIESQRRLASGWLSAPLFELVGNDWAVTTAGVERRGFGTVLRPDDFPKWEPPSGGLADPPGLPHSPPDVPKPDERVTVRAAAYLPFRASPYTPTNWDPKRT